MSQQPNVLVSLPSTLYDTLFTQDADAALRAAARVTFNVDGRNWTPDELAARLPGFDAVITGWGSPVFTDSVLASAGQLRLIAHSAGTIKSMLPPPVFARGIAVTHAAAAMAPAVAEMTLLFILTLLRQFHKQDSLLKAGNWEGAARLGLGGELGGQRVGVIGAGYVGRCTIELLRALKAEVWVFDPYLSEARAAELGARKVALDMLLQGCPVVSLHAPVTPETHHMIGARELGLLQDGATLVNTARSWLVDQDALLAALQSGRIHAALDVFDREPLPPDHPFRGLDNVILAPHVAAGTVEARRRQGHIMSDEIKRFFSGQPLRYGVTAEMLDTMA